MKRRAAEDGSEESAVENEDDGISIVKSKSAGDGSVIYENETPYVRIFDFKYLEKGAGIGRYLNNPP